MSELPLAQFFLVFWRLWVQVQHRLFFTMMWGFSLYVLYITHQHTFQKTTSHYHGESQQSALWYSLVFLRYTQTIFFCWEVEHFNVMGLLVVLNLKTACYNSCWPRVARFLSLSLFFPLIVPPLFSAPYLSRYPPSSSCISRLAVHLSWSSFECCYSYWC